MKKILIVDDNKEICQQFRHIISPLGYQVGYWLKPELLFKRLASEQPDLILLDINMPKVSGDELLQQLKKNAIFSKIPIIMLTAEDDQQMIEHCFALGALDYINKSAGKKIFSARLKSAISTIDNEQQLEEQVQQRTQDLQHEIDEHKKTALQLIQAKEHAESMNRLKTIFLANMTHELRTPLVGINGFAKILMDTSSADNKEYATHILNSGNRLLETISDILDITHIERDKLDSQLEKNQHLHINAEPVDIISTCEQMIQGFAAKAKKQQTSINLIRTNTQYTQNMDKKIFCKILKHLLDNAIKFTEQGEIEISCSQNKTLNCTIKDTGIGISEDFSAILNLKRLYLSMRYKISFIFIFGQ
jgi:two-component system, sensor histidine kinase and response regulator